MQPVWLVACAIVLMSVVGQGVDRAFLRALADPFETIAQIACLEVGDRHGVEGTSALYGMLGHTSWRVRLEACKALITQKTADPRVVATLEAMGREPEASVYDAAVDEFKDLAEEFSGAFAAEGATVENWGKLDTILARARKLARRSTPTARPD